MPLDVRRLKVLREVAARGSFSAAADALAFTQPAVSRQIATLEAEAGTRLVDRTARGVRLTPAGELLVEHAEAILGRLAAAESQLEALAELDAGRLRLGAFPTASATLTALAIAAFADAHPGVELRLVEGRSNETLPMLAAGELDLAVVSDAGADVPADVELEHLMDDPFFVAMPREHPLAAERELRMEDLRDETWIEGRHCADALMAAAHAAGFEPRVAFDSAEWLGKQGLVAAGVGITLIPTLALGTVRDELVLRSLGPDGPRRRIFLATHAWLSPAPAVAPMQAILRRTARDHCFSCDAMISA
ncbi:MAG TPA: LysR substrate-binding domain-containing protein [Solirubrobacteraceae bacterium]|nr:LysR substrate-binding domain-containing protein [Solirubrobacteraceae bacterium]